MAWGGNNRRSGSGSSRVNFEDEISEEEDGICKALEKEGNTVSLCGEKTRNRTFHYCSDCYSVIASEFGRNATKVWPPKREGFNSRYCYDYKTENIFLIPKTWMELYSPPRQSSDGSSIDVKYRKHHSKKGGNYPCWVYVIRLKDNMIYVGQTRDLKRRIHQHKNNPGKTLEKHGGYKHKIHEVKVSNRALAEQLEQFLVEVFRDCSIRATQGFEADN